MKVIVKEFVKNEGMNAKRVLELLKGTVNGPLKGHVFQESGGPLEMDQFAVDFIREYFSKQKEDEMKTKDLSDIGEKLEEYTNDVVQEQEPIQNIDSMVDNDPENNGGNTADELYKVRIETLNANIESLKKVIQEQNVLIEQLNGALEKDAILITRLKQKNASIQIELEQYESSFFGSLKKKRHGDKK